MIIIYALVGQALVAGFLAGWTACDWFDRRGYGGDE